MTNISMTEDKVDLIINLLTSINSKLNPNVILKSDSVGITNAPIPYIDTTKENRKVHLVVPSAAKYSLDDVKALVLKLVTKDEENRTYIREVLATEFNVSTIKDIADNSEALTKLYIILGGKTE